MDYSSSVTPGTPDEDPVQDRVEAPKAKGPSVSGPAANGPAANGPADSGPAVRAPGRPKGPNASAIVVGLVAMVLAGLVIAKETTGLQVDWSRLGPGSIIGIGVVMVILGAIGLVRRHDDV